MVQAPRGNPQRHRPLPSRGGAGLTFLELNQVSAKALLYWTSSFINREYISNPGIGFANGGLGEIYVEPARRYIEARGGRVETGRRVTGLVVRGNEVVGASTEDGETLTADVYISAMPYYELRRVLPESALDYPFFLDLWRLEEAPSVSVQIWFDRFVTSMRNIAAQMQGTFNCFADMHTIVPRFASTATGSMLEFVLTPAFHLRGLPAERIYSKVLEEFRRIMPAAREAEVKKWVVTRERQGIFAQRPGADRFRPPQRTPYPNLYLCGDYTKTFISAGMENACASAHLAVGHALYEHAGREVTLFSRLTAYNAYLRGGLAAGAALAGAALAARSLYGRKRR
ncbi:MAG: FAD-dependent oxidoreductase [Actinobacteria bacterium]|nr:FAD-dependent oxidoreductase [Actinomycetota bacterium]